MAIFNSHVCLPGGIYIHIYPLHIYIYIYPLYIHYISIIWRFLKLVDPQDHRLQYETDPMTWMTWGTPHDLGNRQSVQVIN